MDRSTLRCVVSGALTSVISLGCSSPSPFSDTIGTIHASDTVMGTPGMKSLMRERSDDGRPELPVLDESATLDDYLRYAALNNADLEAKFQQWKAALERLPQVRALPDPRLTYGYYLGEVETRVGPMQHSVSLAQTFPWFGKLKDREDAAARSANAAYQRFEGARLDLTLRVERAYNELFFLKKSIEIATDNIELLQQFERVARSRYRVNAAGHPDLIRIQVELGTIEDRLRQHRDLRPPYTARLNAAMNRAANAPIPWPDAVSTRTTDIDRDQLFAVLSERNPELIALQEEIERERIAAEIARKDGLPDLTVGFAYTSVGKRNNVKISENGDDALLATFSINLPIWREKYDAGVREAIARRLAVASRRSETINTFASDLQEALFEHHDARRRVELYSDTLIPKALESLQASLGGFKQGQSDFLDLIDTQRTLLEFQLGFERARADRATAYARIEKLVGITLTDIETSATTEGGTP